MEAEACERITVREMHGMLEAIEHGSFLVRPTRTAVPERSRTSETSIFLFSQDGTEEQDTARTEQDAPAGPPPPPTGDGPPPPPPQEQQQPPLASELPPPPPPRDEPPPLPTEPPSPPTDGPAFGTDATDRPLAAKPSEPHEPTPPEPEPSPQDSPSPAPPPARRSRLAVVLMGGLLLAVLCGGSGLVGLLLYRPDLLVGVPVLEDAVPSSGDAGQQLEKALQARLDTLATQAVVHCSIHARVSADVRVTTAGVVVPGPAHGIPMVKKARCFEAYLAGYVLKPAPTKDLSLRVEVPG